MLFYFSLIQGLLSHMDQVYRSSTRPAHAGWYLCVVRWYVGTLVHTSTLIEIEKKTHFWVFSA